jgi:hypothetical protein
VAEGRRADRRRRGVLLAGGVSIGIALVRHEEQITVPAPAEVELEPRPYTLRSNTRSSSSTSATRPVARSGSPAG